LRMVMRYDLIEVMIVIGGGWLGECHRQQQDHFYRGT
jgi:hypothetical protein